jgi:ABC-type dipeptide/oligopeptide/nickel transport system ATPase component
MPSSHQARPPDPTRIVVATESAAPADSRSGCPFVSRCPHPLKDAVCAEEVPALESKAPGHFAACPKPLFVLPKRG